MRMCGCRLRIRTLTCPEGKRNSFIKNYQKGKELSLSPTLRMGDTLGASQRVVGMGTTGGEKNKQYTALCVTYLRNKGILKGM